MVGHLTAVVPAVFIGKFGGSGLASVIASGLLGSTPTEIAFQVVQRSLPNTSASSSLLKLLGEYAEAVPETQERLLVQILPLLEANSDDIQRACSAAERGARSTLP